MLNQLLENYKIILGSGSPRRKELLGHLDIVFEVKKINVDESFPTYLTAYQVPKYLAEKKAKAYENIIEGNWLVITADTVVILDGQILGKPHNAEKAQMMLSALSGKPHQVVTGVCIKTKASCRCFDESTTVWFKTLSTQEIDYYIKNYRPFDKAGGYGIQEWIGYIGIEKIEGSYQNVVGLPVQRLYVELFNFLKLQKQGH